MFNLVFKILCQALLLNVLRFQEKGKQFITGEIINACVSQVYQRNLHKEWGLFLKLQHRNLLTNANFFDFFDKIKWAKTGPSKTLAILKSRWAISGSAVKMRDVVWEFAQRDFWITSVFEGPVFTRSILSKKSKKFAFASRFLC